VELKHSWVTSSIRLFTGFIRLYRQKLEQLGQLRLIVGKALGTYPSSYSSLLKAMDTFPENRDTFVAGLFLRVWQVGLGFHDVFSFRIRIYMCVTILPLIIFSTWLWHCF